MKAKPKTKKNDSLAIRMSLETKNKIKIAAMKKGYKHLNTYIMDLLKKDGVKVD